MMLERIESKSARHYLKGIWFLLISMVFFVFSILGFVETLLRMNQPLFFYWFGVSTVFLFLAGAGLISFVSFHDGYYSLFGKEIIIKNETSITFQYQCLLMSKALEFPKYKLMKVERWDFQSLKFKDKRRLMKKMGWKQTGYFLRFHFDSKYRLQFMGGEEVWCGQGFTPEQVDQFEAMFDLKPAPG